MDLFIVHLDSRYVEKAFTNISEALTYCKQYWERDHKYRRNVSAVYTRNAIHILIEHRTGYFRLEHCYYCDHYTITSYKVRKKRG